MLINKRQNVLIEFKNGDLKQVQVSDRDLYENIIDTYDMRKIKRLKVILKDNKNHVIGYHVFFDSLTHEKVNLGEVVTMLYADEEKTGYIDYTSIGTPYYTFAEVGERRGVKIDVSLIQKFLK